MCEADNASNGCGVCYAPGLVVWRIAVHASNRSRSRRPFISKAIFLLNS
jgi:hypothetical protein